MASKAPSQGTLALWALRPAIPAPRRGPQGAKFSRHPSWDLTAPQQDKQPCQPCSSKPDDEFVLQTVLAS